MPGESLPPGTVVIPLNAAAEKMMADQAVAAFEATMEAFKKKPNETEEDS